MNLRPLYSVSLVLLCCLAVASYSSAQTYSVETCTNAFENLYPSGGKQAPKASQGDDAADVVPIGFTFKYYGNSYTQVAISSNGYLTFGNDRTTYQNVKLPNTAVPNDAIYPYWDDWRPNVGGTVEYVTRTGPTRFIAQWSLVRHGDGSKIGVFQAILFGDGNIEFRYGHDLPKYSPNVGIENKDGTDGVDVDFNLVGSDRCVRLAVPAPAPATPASVDAVIHREPLVSGYHHTCALMDNGQVECWGDNSYGQLGDNSSYRRYTPVKVSGLPKAVALAAGYYHTCALLSNREVQCWGRNTNGQLGDGSQSNNRLTPVKVRGLSNVTQVVAGSEYTCALTSNGEVQCWGRNNVGQLGDGSTTDRPTPAKVSGLGEVESLVAGTGHTCAATSTDTVRCWGYNNHGQAGTGNTSNATTPSTVSGLSNVSSLAAGFSHTCAGLSDGTVRCWGKGSYGRLGNNSTADQHTPVPVSNLSDAVLVSSKTEHTCAVLSNGKVKCWGYNSNRQLGDSSSSQRNTPVNARVLSPFTTAALALGGSNTCALLSPSGEVKCWGYNGYGQLGDGTSNTRHSPVIVKTHGKVALPQVADAADLPAWCRRQPAQAGCDCAPIDLNHYGYGHIRNPIEVESENGRLHTTLEVIEASNHIAGCSVSLRSYNGDLVGPTLRAKPGDTLHITLKNELEHNKLGSSTDHNDPLNNTSQHNTTNLHTHGLHVSPSGNSDNVLVRVHPKTEYQLEVDIPENHPPGTFWYHPHVHGSTALQVSSGMVGALIIEGGLDKVPAIAAAEDHILIFTQTPYDNRGKNEGYRKFFSEFWRKSHRVTLVNGQLAPTIYMRPGEVQRWRFIHASFEESIKVGLDAHDLHEIAVDGLALGRMVTWPAGQGIEMGSGYRRDVLVKAKPLSELQDYVHKGPDGKPVEPQEAVIYLWDLESLPEESLHRVYEPERILARVVIQGPPVDMQLPTAEQLKPLKPFKDITDAELQKSNQKVEKVAFNLSMAWCPPDDPLNPDKTKRSPDCVMCPANPKQASAPPECKKPENEKDIEFRFMVNNRPFSPLRVRTLELGAAQKWEVASDVHFHPFHIHVNAFQYTRDEPDGRGGMRKATVWGDTVLVKGPSVEQKFQWDAEGKSFQEQQKLARQQHPALEIRTRYEDYIGDFVFHCHILEHEDRGMMELVRIVTPGALKEGAHH